MTPIETIAVVLAVGALLKILLIMAKPSWLMSFSDKLMGNKALFTLVALILVAITGYYVLYQGTVDIVTVGAVMGLTGALMMLAWAPYSKIVLDMRRKMTEGALRKSWLSIIIWAVIAVWILYAVFA